MNDMDLQRKTNSYDVFRVVRSHEVQCGYRLKG